jgi:hypothetical protein
MQEPGRSNDRGRFLSDAQRICRYNYELTS